ncbi:MAG: Uncharacterised protein [Flavobacteriia bacterium]|nr:MAG: Uncharacterised protein [Flavobacteriia bacterium]
MTTVPPGPCSEARNTSEIRVHIPHWATSISPLTRSTLRSGEHLRRLCPHLRRLGNWKNSMSPTNWAAPMDLRIVRSVSPTAAFRETSFLRPIGASSTDGSWTMWKFWLLRARLHRHRQLSICNLPPSLVTTICPWDRSIISTQRSVWT